MRVENNNPVFVKQNQLPFTTSICGMSSTTIKTALIALAIIGAGMGLAVLGVIALPWVLGLVSAALLGLGIITKCGLLTQKTAERVDASAASINRQRGAKKRSADSLLDPRKMGVAIEKSRKELPSISDRTRYTVRDNTIGAISGHLALSLDPSDKEIHSKLEKVAESAIGKKIRIPRDLKQLLEQVTLYTPSDESSQADQKSRGTALLGRYDVLATPCRMDYNAKWQKHQTERFPFLVHHAAAPNIGESANAEDFASFSNDNGQLDEDKYLRAMSQIFTNIIQQQIQSGVSDAVWIPFGMGAFLRHLGDNDSRYKDRNTMIALRNQIAEVFVKVVGKFAKRYSYFNIHLCLPTESNPHSATNDNYNAFIRAIFEEGNPKVTNAIRVYINEDGTDLAQHLAQKKAEYKVSLVNTANRNLLGNHWYSDRARHAMDENLHRRSSLLATISLLLNQGMPISREHEQRQRGCLAKRVAALGGSVVT